jgi:1-acyl-sn-glycerol-3-phosphate acyltransferase
MIAFIGRLWGWLIIKTCGIKVDYVGLEKILPLDSFVMVANHQSFFDIFALIGTMPHEVRFVAKKELLKIPIFGFALKRSGHVVIDRQRGQSIRKALAVSEGRYCVCVFAEGHRFNDARVHPFNEGAAWLAIQSGMPCVPVAITGSSEFFPRGAKVVVPGGRMQIWIGDPIPTAGLSSKQRGEVTKKLEDSVRAMFSGASG